MYFCRDCNHFFEYPRGVVEVHYELDDRPLEHFLECPHCSSWNFDEIECSVCHMPITEYDDFIKVSNGDFICSDCYEVVEL